jgi:hypothetical protein
MLLTGKNIGRREEQPMVMPQPLKQEGGTTHGHATITTTQTGADCFWLEMLTYAFGLKILFLKLMHCKCNLGDWG